MKKRPADDIVEAQAVLQAKVLKALRKFTNTTGMTCSRIEWDCSTVMDENGHTIKAHYMLTRSEIRTGMN